jgi:hypothetical protein
LYFNHHEITLLFLFLLLYSQHLIAQNKGMIPTGATERRLALVIGNKDYQYIDPYAIR